MIALDGIQSAISNFLCKIVDVYKLDRCYLPMKGKRKMGANAVKRVVTGAHLPTPWLLEPAKRPDDRADYCLGTRR